MRDLRGDLRERLAELDSETGLISHEYSERLHDLQLWFEAKSKMIEEERKAVSTLLSVQMRRNGEQAPSAPPQLPLADFLIEEAGKRGKSSKEDLRLAAVHSSYFPDGESGGRQIHTTLLNLVRSGKLIESPEGRYGIPNQGLSALAQMFGPQEKNEEVTR